MQNIKFVTAVHFMCSCVSVCAHSKTCAKKFGRLFLLHFTFLFHFIIADCDCVNGLSFKPNHLPSIFIFITRILLVREARTITITRDLHNTSD